MEDNKLLSKSFLWMCIGLLVTFVTGYGVSMNVRKYFCWKCFLDTFNTRTYFSYCVIRKSYENEPNSCKDMFYFICFC